MSTPLISVLITSHCNRSEQFEMSLSSLAKQSYNKSLIELLIIIDCFQNKDLISIIKKYKSLFSSVKCYLISNTSFKITHSVTRRNFLAKNASGNYILFSEPEMFHVGHTLKLLTDFVLKQKENYWYCGPVYATQSIVDKNGRINVDEFRGRENISYLLSLIRKDPLLKNEITSKYYFQIDEKKFPTLYFCTLFKKNFFMQIGGLNENMKVRGWEEIELYERFKTHQGKMFFDSNFITIHLPHIRSLKGIQQIGWNLYNSTVQFNHNQVIGNIKENITKISI